MTKSKTLPLTKGFNYALGYKEDTHLYHKISTYDPTLYTDKNRNSPRLLNK